jgi:hypothetical protein
MDAFSGWLSHTSISVYFQEQLGFLAFLQAIHIMAVAMIGSSVLMINLRVLGVAGRSQTMRQVAHRFVPWLWGGLLVLILTALPLIIAEPRRDLTNWTFQLKMTMIAAGIAITLGFARSVRRNADAWDKSPNNLLTKALAIITVLLWVAIAICGRWIAYTWH